MSYFCPSCAVFGKGSACWNCGTTDLERDSESVLEFEMDWKNGTTAHRCIAGGRQPLLT